MLSAVCMVGFIFSAHGSHVDSTQDACMTVSKEAKAQCTDDFELACPHDQLIMVTNITFVENTIRIPNKCTDCWNPFPGQIINVSHGGYDRQIDFILSSCSFQHWCSLWFLQQYHIVTSVRYTCIFGNSKLDMCNSSEQVINKGDVSHLVLQRSGAAGKCSCRINGSTELRVEDFFRVFYSFVDNTRNTSDSVLFLDNEVFKQENAHNNIFHSHILHVNITNVTISFDDYFQRLWLWVDIKENGTKITCRNESTNTTTDVISSTFSQYLTTLIDPGPVANATPVQTNQLETTVTSASVVMNTSYMSLLLSTVTSSENINSTSATTNASTTLIVYVASGCSATVVLIIVCVIVVSLYRRKNRPGKLTHAAKNKPNIVTRPSSIDRLGFENLAMQAVIDNDYDCQTVAHIPRITRGSVEYAVSVPPGIYNYAFTSYQKSEPLTFQSKTEATGLPKTESLLANAAEGFCNPYFCLLPLNEQGNRATADDPSNDDSIIREPHGDTIDALNHTEPTMHVYNHIMIGRGVTEGASGIICSDEYSHISIDGINESGKARYYNIVNIRAAMDEPADDYCHIGPTNANIHAHVSRDDYNHVVL